MSLDPLARQIWKLKTYYVILVINRASSTDQLFNDVNVALGSGSLKRGVPRLQKRVK